MPNNKIDPFILENYIQNSGLSFKETSRSFVFTCPRCKKDKLYIRKTDGVFICFVCAESNGFKGLAPKALAEMLSLSISDVLREFFVDNITVVDQLKFNLIDWYNTEITEEFIHNKNPIKFEEHFLDIIHPDCVKAQKYLANRNVNLTLATKYNLKFDPISNRVIIPIMEKGILYGWQGRSIDATEWHGQDGVIHKKPKMITSVGLVKNHFVMFYDNLLGCDHAIVCEGPFDALMAESCGGAIATMGKAVSDEQIALIANAGVKKIYLALDPDAKIEIQKLTVKFYGVELYLLFPTKGFKDLGEMNQAQVKEAFLQAPRIYPGNFI